jgi:hypothetical protein
MKKLEINRIDKEMRIQLSFGDPPSEHTLDGRHRDLIFLSDLEERVFAPEQSLARVPACSRFVNPVKVPGTYSTAKASRTLPGVPRSPKM